jgi:hypothetical protein
MGKGESRLVRTSALSRAQRVSIIRSQLNVTQKYLPATDRDGRVEDKVKASLTGGGNGQDSSQYSEAETSFSYESSVSVLLMERVW